MKINWKVRFRNRVFWTQIIALVVVPVLTYFGLEFKDITSWQSLGQVIVNVASNPYVIGLIVVGVFNALNDPTVAGLSDSARALNYDKPSPNANQE